MEWISFVIWKLLLLIFVTCLCIYIIINFFISWTRFELGCPNYWEAGLGPSCMGEEACNTVWSISCYPIRYCPVCAGERIWSKCWGNIWEIWCVSSWFCLHCTGIQFMWIKTGFDFIFIFLIADYFIFLKKK